MSDVESMSAKGKSIGSLIAYVRLECGRVGNKTVPPGTTKLPKKAKCGAHGTMQRVVGPAPRNAR